MFIAGVLIRCGTAQYSGDNKGFHHALHFLRRRLVDIGARRDRFHFARSRANTGSVLPPRTYLGLPRQLPVLKLQPVHGQRFRNGRLLRHQPCSCLCPSATTRTAVLRTLTRRVWRIRRNEQAVATVRPGAR